MHARGRWDSHRQDQLVRSTQTNEERNSISGDAGVYRILNLQPGTYEVTASLAGFPHYWTVLTINKSVPIIQRAKTG
jgi:hypothetical protein